MTAAISSSSPHKMQIRLATRDDVIPLAQLFAASVRAIGPDAYSPAQVEAWAASAEQRETFRDLILRPKTYVACDSSGPIGFCGLEPDGHVVSVYVRPDCARQGIGGCLLRHIIAEAAASGIESLYAEASEFSLPLFLKYGFHVTGQETVERNNVTFTRHLVKRRLASGEAC